MGYIRAFLFPVNKTTLYLAKMALLCITLAASLLLCFLTIVLSGKLLDLLEPKFGFGDFDSLPVLAAFFARFIPFLLLFSAIHYIAAFVSKHLLVSFGLAVALLVFGVFAGLSKQYFWLFPGSWLRNAESAVNASSAQVGWTDCLWAVLLLVSGARVFVSTRAFE